MVGAHVRAEQARFAQKRGLGQRRACALIGVSRSSLYYRARLPLKDGVIIEAMKRLSGEHPRFGARRIRILLQRQGIVIGKTRCRRLWVKASLQVPRKKRRKMSISRRQIARSLGANNVWSYDFVHDKCANGQKLKCLTVVDEYTRECLAIEVSGHIRSSDVISTLSRLMSIHGAPRCMRSDNGPEFISRALLSWANEAGLKIANPKRTAMFPLTRRYRVSSSICVNLAVQAWLFPL